jgi:hypothetical protein
VIRSLSFLPFQTVNYMKILFGCLLQEMVLLQQTSGSGWVIFCGIRNVAKYAAKLGQ